MQINCSTHKSPSNSLRLPSKREWFHIHVQVTIGGIFFRQHAKQTKKYKIINKRRKGKKSSSMTFLFEKSDNSSIWEKRYSRNRKQQKKTNEINMNVWFWIIFLCREKKGCLLRSEPSKSERKRLALQNRWEPRRRKSNQFKTKWISFSTECISVSLDKHTRTYMEKQKQTTPEKITFWKSEHIHIASLADWFFGSSQTICFRNIIFLDAGKCTVK